MFRIKRKSVKPSKRKRSIYTAPKQSLLKQNLENLIVEKPIDKISNSTLYMPPLSVGIKLETTRTQRYDNDKYEKLLMQALVPVLPMLAKPMEPTKIQFDHRYILEEKFDGERMLAVVVASASSSASSSSSNCITKYYTRTLKASNTFKYEVHLKPSIKNCILDGELVYLNIEDGKLVPICDIGMKRALRMQYRIFDVQTINGGSVMHKPLVERKQLLHTILIETSHVVISKCTECLNYDQVMGIFNDVVSKGGEGLILKQLDEPYTTNCRNWIKLKSLHINSRKEEFDLYAHRMIKDKNGIPNILDCGYYDDCDKFVHVTKVSSGMDNSKRMRLQAMCNNATGLFNNRTIVTLIADKITANRSLRHPSIHRIRTDLDSIDVSRFIATLPPDLQTSA